MQLKAINTEIEFGTNILSIEVPEHLNKKATTGISYIDEAMGGKGFTPSAVTLFTGAPGAGKTTMMLTMADGFTKEGAVCLFNTAEESLYQTAMTARRLKLRNGFLTGNSADINEVINKSVALIEANPGKQFVLIVDSLQCMDDGKYSSGHISSGTAIRCLQMVTDFCKEYNAIAVVINQVNKSGKMSGSNKLKHMVDAHLHLGIEEKDEDWKGCRILETQKNRFGGCGYHFMLDMTANGFYQLAKVSSY